MTISTHFAEAERLYGELLERQVSAFSPDSNIGKSLDVSPDMVAVLNEHRQIVFMNRVFKDFLDTGDGTTACGERPGEVLNCVHSRKHPGGCGTSKQCRSCGAALAIVQALKEQTSASRECVIASRNEKIQNVYEFLVTTAPFSLDGESYVFISLRNNEVSKQRLAMERIFFHDILNTASSMKVYIDLLKREQLDSGMSVAMEKLETICGTLIEEIKSHKTLFSAENGTLTVEKNLIASTSLIEELLDAVRPQDYAADITLEVQPFSESFPMINDEILVRRVLLNMLKNALEASKPGDTVKVGFRKLGDHTGEFAVWNPAAIPEEARNEIFRRNYSTKGSNRGLGTYSMKLLTEQYLEGRIWFETSETEGTTFFLSLPAM